MPSISPLEILRHLLPHSLADRRRVGEDPGCAHGGGMDHFIGGVYGPDAEGFALCETAGSEAGAGGGEEA